MCGHVAEIETLDQFFDTRLAFGLGQVKQLCVQHQVLAHAQLAVQREALRHETHALAGGQILGVHRVAQQFGAAFGGRHQPGEDLHGGGFAATVRAQKAKNFAPANGKADVVHCGEIAEFQGQVVGFNGDITVVAGARWNHQWLAAVAAVTLIVGEGLVELAGGGDRRQFLAQAGGNQFAAIQHQAVFELLGLFHIGRRHQQRQLRALAAHIFHQLPEASA